MSELRKQAIDQPLHVLMCAASVLALSSPIGWTGVAVWVATVVGVLLTCVWVGLREFLQYPSRESFPLDWLLDAVFEVAGIALGAWLYFAFVGPMLA
jgi:hypothetical protein